MNKHLELIECCDEHLNRDILKWKEGEPYTPTIYLLTRNSKIVYIGESGWPLRRFKSHTSKTPYYKDWDKVYFKSFDSYVKGDNLRYIESMVMTYLGELTEYNKIFRRVELKDKNPLNSDFLNPYLEKVKEEYEKREQERIQEHNRMYIYEGYRRTVSLF